MFKNLYSHLLPTSVNQPVQPDFQVLASQNAGHSLPNGTDATVGHYWPSRIEWIEQEHRSAFIRATDGQWPRVYLKILSREEVVDKISHDDSLHDSDDSLEQRFKIKTECENRLPSEYSGVEKWFEEPGQMHDKLEALDLGLTCRLFAVRVGPGSSELLDRNYVEGETRVPFVKDLEVVVPKDLNMKAGGVGRGATSGEKGPWYGYAEFKDLSLTQPGRYKLFADILDKEAKYLTDHHVCFVQTQDITLTSHKCHRSIEIFVSPRGTESNEVPSDAWYQAHGSMFDDKLCKRAPRHVSELPSMGGGRSLPKDGLYRM